MDVQGFPIVGDRTVTHKKSVEEGMTCLPLKQRKFSFIAWPLASLRGMDTHKMKSWCEGLMLQTSLSLASLQFYGRFCGFSDAAKPNLRV